MKNRPYIAHFKKVDPKIYNLALAYPLEDLEVSKDHFEKLCREIIGQQLSGKVARVIFGRFKELFLKGKIDPKTVLKLDPEKIRSVGMSNSKVAFIRDLSQKVVSKELDFAKIDTLEDELIIKSLTRVHGIGPWTAEMFLIFSLGRLDVFSTGDLGLLRAVEKLYGIKNPSKEKLSKISVKWSPYRSYASRLLWKSLDNEG